MSWGSWQTVVLNAHFIDLCHRGRLVQSKFHLIGIKATYTMASLRKIGEVLLAIQNDQFRSIMIRS